MSLQSLLGSECRDTEIWEGAVVGPQGQMSPRADDPVRAPQPTVLELARARYRAATRNKTRPPPICTDSKPRPPSSPRASLLLVTWAKPRRSPRDALFPSRNETSPRPAGATFLATAADDKGARSSGGPAGPVPALGVSRPHRPHLEPAATHKRLASAPPTCALAGDHDLGPGCPGDGE